MIIVTGAAGFIGSCLVSRLNDDGFSDLILVDEFSNPEKSGNLDGKTYAEKVDRNHFFEWLKENKNPIDFILHIGARTNTAEFDYELLNKLNLNYTKDIWNYCAENNVPLVYASSGATYGAGEFGYDDNIDTIEKLQPLNPYGESKNEFDKWALKQTKTPPFWYGLKFFNVYGPNEYHKGRMASVVFHTFHQVKVLGKMNLFRSHRPDFKDGMQLRDFVYVKDVVNVVRFLMDNKPQSSIYNLGTGCAESFLALANAAFDAMGKDRNIEFIDIPEDIRDKYQYFTEAKIEKLRKAGYTDKFYALEEGVRDYVQNYLLPNNYL